MRDFVFEFSGNTLQLSAKLKLSSVENSVCDCVTILCDTSFGAGIVTPPLSIEAQFIGYSTGHCRAF